MVCPLPLNNVALLLMVTRRFSVDDREYTRGTLFRSEPPDCVLPSLQKEGEREVESPHILIALVSRTTLDNPEDKRNSAVHWCP